MTDCGVLTPTQNAAHLLVVVLRGVSSNLSHDMRNCESIIAIAMPLLAQHHCHVSTEGQLQQHSCPTSVQRCPSARADAVERKKILKKLATAGAIVAHSHDMYWECL